MRIQHNIPSMNAYRNYNNNAGALNRNLEKLSSGYRINRAGDDAAGLAISEKMRAQITGLDAASKNVKDGISLVKTAEGAMQEVHDMLGRMKYLATQSSNGTYQDDVDRENIQKEVNSLLDEINRIADSANFNGQKLLNGELDNVARGSDMSLPPVGTTLGKDTRLHEDSKTAVKGEYTVDFGDAKIQARASNGSSGTITIGLGNNVTLTATVSGTDATWADPANVASLVSDAFTRITSGTSGTGNGYTVSISGAAYHTAANGSLSSGWYLGGSSSTDMKAGNRFSVTTSGNSVKFQQLDDPTMDSTFGVNHDISVSGSSAFQLKNEMTYNQKSVNAKGPVVKSDGQKASTVINLTKDLMNESKSLKIGDQTITFVKGDKATQAVAGTVVKIGDLLEELKNNIPEDDVMKKLAYRIIQAANGNNAWVVSTQGVKKGELMLTESDNAVTNDYDFSNVQNITSSLNSLVAGKGLNLQIGDTSDKYNQMSVGVKDMHAKSLGIAGLDVSTADAANTSIDKIKKAIDTVSSTRGDLGAIQNRLEHTSNNLSVMKENIQDAEATIRDTDVADEMMKYTKNNILLQSAQAMLAQANQLPQGVLQLLQ